MCNEPKNRNEQENRAVRQAANVLATEVACLRKVTQALSERLVYVSSDRSKNETAKKAENAPAPECELARDIHEQAMYVRGEVNTLSKLCDSLEI